MIHYRTVNVTGHRVFYREAGDSAKPTLLLLHGFPTSSHMFCDLIPLLADYHVVAPDLPGFGDTVSPAGFDYSFDNLALVIGGFVDAIGLREYALYVFDYVPRLAIGSPWLTPSASLPSSARTGTRIWKDSATPGGVAELLEVAHARESERLPGIAHTSDDSEHSIPAWQRCAKLVAGRLHAGHRLHGPARRGGNSTRSDPRLSQQCGDVPDIPGILQDTSSATARSSWVRTTRTSCHLCRGVSARYPECGSSLA